MGIIFQNIMPPSYVANVQTNMIILNGFLDPPFIGYWFALCLVFNFISVRYFLLSIDSDAS